MQKPNDFTGEDWKLVWSDEFNGNGKPSALKWDYERGYVRNNEEQFYTNRTKNARMETGNLVIEARAEEIRGKAYSAASVITLGKAGWLYGRFVVRAKLPKGRGTWPAIWMLGEDMAKVGWPRCGEIDIMEHVGHNPGVVHATIHQKPEGAKEKISEGGTIAVPDASDAFHVYAVEWHEDRLDFFLDDKKYWTYPNQGPDKWVFHKKFYLLLNFAVGGAWGGQKGVDASVFPQKFTIDFVRVYQRAA